MSLEVGFQVTRMQRDRHNALTAISLVQLVREEHVGLTSGKFPVCRAIRLAVTYKFALEVQLVRAELAPLGPVLDGVILDVINERMAHGRSVDDACLPASRSGGGDQNG